MAILAMVIKGNIRGNGRQLAQYLMREGANDHVRILDVDGRDGGGADYLLQTLASMSLMEQLTKSQQGIYHAQINPAYGEDCAMRDEDWLLAADILGRELGFEHQRRAIVLHEKKGRIHAHVVWERYDHDRGVMIPIDFNYKRHDNARAAIEKTLDQQRTPTRNTHRPELKETMTGLWHETETAGEFIARVEQAGYMLAAGTRRPFMLVDKDGCSCDLVRQIKGVRKKEVAERLVEAVLMPEKEAIAVMQQRKAEAVKRQREHTPPEKKRHDTSRMTQAVHGFADNRDDIFAGEKKKDNAHRFAQIAHAFADNRDEALSREHARDKRKQELVAEMQAELKRIRQKGRDLSR